MKASERALELIDLSYLSAEEEAAIRQVLLRDEDLKRLETGRVRKLRQSVPDFNQLKTLTGEWFEELREKRYGQQTDVTAVVRSSMRWKKTAAHKSNPFLKYIVEENKEGEKETHGTPPSASSDPRLIHPALSKETYRQFTDDDFLQDSLAGKSSSEKLKASNDHRPAVNNTDPRNSSTEAQPKGSSEKLRAANAHKAVFNGTDPRNNSTEAQPKDSGDSTTTNFQLSNAVQMQPETTSERNATKDATNAVPRRKISLPPALQKDQSFEENWVKIYVEPNPAKPAQNKSSSVGPKLKDVSIHGENTETLMKQGILDQKKVDRFGGDLGINTESLNFVDQTTFQIVSKKSPQAEPTHSTQSQASLVEVNDKSNISGCSDHKGSEVNESGNAFQGSIARNQQNANKCTESETDALFFSNFTNEHDKSKVISRDSLNVEASSDRKGGERKNVSTGMLAKTDTDQVFQRVAVEKQINKHSTVEEASQSQSLKRRIETGSHEIPSDPLQGKDDFRDFKHDHPVEMGKNKSSNIHIELLLPNPKTTQSVVESHVSDITVQQDLEAYKDKEKNKMDPSHDLDLTDDTHRNGLELSKDHLSMTDDRKLVQSGDVTLHVESKHKGQYDHEDKEKIKMKPSRDLNLTEYSHRPGHGLAELSKDHLLMTDDGKVHSGDVTLHVDNKHDDRTASKTIQPAKSPQLLSEDTVGPLTVTKLPQGSSEIKDVEGNRETDQRTESDILLSVLARAQRARPPVFQKITAEEPKQEARDEKVPTIVIMPSESPDPKEMEGNKRGAFVLEALAEGSKMPSYTADAWEDEGVDSDDDTSVSSYGSDLSGRKGHSASALSLTDRTGSLLSVYSDAGDFGNVQVQGSVEFALMYSPVGELTIMIEQCQDLAIANPRKQRTDPYVKTYLYPDKSRRSKKKTSIKKRTVNPVYLESLRYKVTRDELPGKTLNLSVWHNDSRGRNVFLGQVEINLKTWDWGHEALTWYNLQPKTSENPESQESNGSLSVSLKYVSPEPTGGSKNSSGEIHVWLREAKALGRLKPQGVDSFVKCYILPDTRKKSRQKTRVIKKTPDPVYNHTMVYDGFKPGEVIEACCELTVWDHNTLSNQFLGGVRLSLGTGQSYGKKVDWMDSMNEEVQLWKRMMANPNSWVEGQLPLRSSMTPRK